MQTLDELELNTSEAIQLPQPLHALEHLSWNYWWSWAPDGAAVFRDLDPELWQVCEQNPRRLLLRVSEYRLTQMACDPAYTKRVRELAESFDEYMSHAPQSSVKGQVTAEHPVAYFCAEYGIHNSLPLYSGGLGMLAGDHLKSASDLNLPLVAVGLFYRYGYFRQRLQRDGWQQEDYGEADPTQLPVHLMQDEMGARITVELEIRGRHVIAQVWQVAVGRIKLHLLDTNIPNNDPVDRLVTGHLYGGDRETRVVQEMMLGIGGVRLLRRLRIEPSVFHLNEGHSAFLTLELARERMKREKVSFAEAAKAVRERCVFTTHTPVAAGNDEFDPKLVSECLGEAYIKSFGLSDREFVALGRIRADNEAEAFGMTSLAIKMCRSTNGVSRKHGEVSRSLWHEMWPEQTDKQLIPITHVTNGVHSPTWVAPPLRELFERYVGKNWTEIIRDPQAWEAGVAKISDEELWATHGLLKHRLIAFIRNSSYVAWKQRGESLERRKIVRTMFDPEALTIGFARRIAAYKRWSLLMSDPERLLRLMEDAARPVQFVFAGKAHPQDQGAKLILQQVAEWKNDPRVRHRAVFLQDYDQEIARQLVQSVDVWLNVPRRPLEASGTSGQKVALNGGLNLSVLDGWWIEGYDGTNGWAVGRSHAEPPSEPSEAAQMEAAAANATDREDREDGQALYRLLEEEVVPCYYDNRDEAGIPVRWVGMMRRSIQTLGSAFSSDRMVQDYVRDIYE